MPKKILVLGATGTQGFPVVRELIAAGHEVAGFTLENDRQIDTLRDMGAKVICGNLLSMEDLVRAMEGMDGVVFIPAIPTADNPIPEITVGYNVILAAERTNVQYLIHTSVDRAGEHESFERWGKEFWSSYRMYWIGKSVVIDFVKACAVPHWTILKPAYMMDCFLPPKAFGMYPLMAAGKLVSARNMDARITMMCGDDVGKLVAEAFSNFDAFEGKEIPLAGDSLNMVEIAAAISKAAGKQVDAVCMTREEMMADPATDAAIKNIYKDFAGMDTSAVLSGVIDAFEWDNVNGYKADIAYANSFGVKLSTFEEWCQRHKDEFPISGS